MKVLASLGNVLDDHQSISRIFRVLEKGGEPKVLEIVVFWLVQKYRLKKKTTRMKLVVYLFHQPRLILRNELRLSVATLKPTPTLTRANGFQFIARCKLQVVAFLVFSKNGSAMAKWFSIDCKVQRHTCYNAADSHNHQNHHDHYDYHYMAKSQIPTMTNHTMLGISL